MRCETCTHWARWRDSTINLGTCKKVLRYWEATDWDATTFDDTLVTPDAKFFVQDAEDYSASLYTRNNFGCVEYMEKANASV